MKKMILFISMILLISSSIFCDGPAPVDLGTSENYVILAKTGVSTTGTTAIVGNIGLSPAAATYITGFGLILRGTYSISSMVTGKVYAADYTSPTPSNLTTAIGDMELAYTDAAGRPDPDFTELYAGDLTGQTLVPGLYSWSSGVLISAGGVTIAGAPDDIWIFQLAQNLTVADGAIVTLSGGARPENIFWQIAGETTIGTTVQFKGIILCQTLISLNTGATSNGRLLAQTAVTLDANSVVDPVPGPIQAEYVFLSEYIEGSSVNKAIEIYNGTNVSIDLSDYQVKLASNGADWVNTQSLSGSLASGDVFVIYNSGAVSGITDVGDLISNTVINFNGNDAVGLFYDGDLIDVIGIPGVLPAVAWDVAGTSSATADHTLVRKSTISTGNTDWAASAGTDVDDSEWIVYPQDTFTFLGSHTVDPPLPVSLSSFTTEYLNNSPVLSWTTQSETDNLGFNLYRSENENGFAEEDSFQINAELIPGMGTSTEPTDYTLVDEYPVIEGLTYWYWLESVSTTNEIELHGPISLTIPIQGEIPNSISGTFMDPNYPNPFNPLTTINFNIDEDETGTLTIFNIKGESVFSETFVSGEYHLQWEAEGLSSGIYFYRLLTPSIDITKKMILLK